MFAPEVLYEAERDDGAALRLADEARLMVSITPTQVSIYYGLSGVTVMRAEFGTTNRMAVIRAAIVQAVVAQEALT